MADSQAQYQSSIDLVVAGKPAPMTFSNKTGGGVTGSGQKSFAGDMLPQRANGGLLEREDVTMEFEFVPARDHEWVQWLKTQAYKADASYVENGLDVNGNVWGKLEDGTGKLGDVSVGDYDSGSSERKKGKITLELDGIPG
jgi:hypothetical protein